ncbi:MAG TPA: peroxiredoxin [Caldilineaceae bacterium]|nr:peroxiredoxin [Caldilineaceae bacterium]
MQIANFPHLRLQELQQSFSALEPQIEEGPVKQALALLHAMVQESLRNSNLPGAASPQAESAFRQLEQLRNYHRHAPAMEGEAVAAGLPVGAPAPDFELPDANGKTVRLSDFRGQPVVLVFYPLDWSPACSDQLSLYQMELEEFRKYGAVLLGISVDSIYSHGAWALLRGLQFPLLSDFEPKGAVARRYNVYRERDGFSERALYVVDPEGIIRYAHVSPQLPHIPDIYELFDALARIRGAVAEPDTQDAAAPVEKEAAL